MKNFNEKNISQYRLGGTLFSTLLAIFGISSYYAEGAEKKK